MRYEQHALAVVFSPHLDDAVYSAWSVLRQPGTVRVVNLCTGIPARGSAPRWDRIAGATDSAAFMELRLAENTRLTREVERLTERIYAAMTADKPPPQASE